MKCTNSPHASVKANTIYNDITMPKLPFTLVPQTSEAFISLLSPS